MNKLKIGIIMDLLERMIQKGATKFEICAVYSHLGELLFEPNRELWVWGTYVMIQKIERRKRK